ncbi:hypothetical protein ACFW04_003129 [Cataglyphis niger]
MAIAASENYQLKWHSYGAHLHSSVATLLHSESFADVLLATSCGRHVAAHRFVLAACSSYLSHIFQTCHFGANTNAPIIVVLPTEIGYRTLKILIQYMYSGEATVTNDQLEGVLKAGDILRVRGLWRSNTGSSKKENIQSNNQKIERDKREPSQLTGQIQKIKLVQPSTEKIVENAQQAATACQNNVQPSKPVERKSTEKIIEEKTNESDAKKILEENKNNEQNKNKENLETNGKKKKTVNSDVESNKSKSEGGENEIVHSADEDGDMEEEEYTPLTCDMCSQTFNRPSDWVRHIEFTHADMTENRRKKRKDDVNDDSKDFPPLKCDLCGNMYSTPQEWVRHIQTEHTEEQLALMNNSAPPKPKRVHNHQKLCNICQKEFPSHASMVIHQRTHTGEKPFLCSYCKKGFNVKSNLLRHLRTLHDKYVHPSLYGSNGSTNA